MKRFLWLGLVLFLYVICTGCGDTFRPIIIPNPPTFPNPAAAHTVVSINDNGTFVPGSAMVIDVSGDTDVSNANVNLHPVHAVQQTATQVLVVNQAVTGLNVPTTSCLVTILPNVFDVCSSLTKLSFSGTIINSTSTISLPIYSGSNFVAAAPSATTAYVTLPTYPPDPTQPQTIVPSVGVVNTQTNNLVATIPVVKNPPAGANPYALAVTPDNTKLYVANYSTPCNPPTAGICSISAFNINTVDLSTRGISGSLSSPPIWLSARSDSQAVYVLETNGTLASIDTISTAGPDTLTESTTINVQGATTMIYDSNKNRLYIPGGQHIPAEVAIVDVSQSPPQFITGAPITLSTVAPSARGAADPCSLTNATTLTVGAVAALPDGSRAYVGAYYEDEVDNVNYICPQVTVIDVASNTIKPPIAVPGFTAYDAFCSNTRFRITMAAGGDSTRAYLASCDGGMVNIIDTSSDSYILNVPAPIGSRSGSQLNLPQNPVFLFAGP